MSQTDEPTDGQPPGFTITRTFATPVERVWRAWTEPDAFHAWLQRMGTRRDSVFADVRPGGRYGYTMRNESTGDTYPTGGEYLEVDEPRRLRFTWGGEQDPVDQAMSVVTLVFEPDRDGSRLVFELEGFPGQPGDGNVYDGWDQALGYLADSLD